MTCKQGDSPKDGFDWALPGSCSAMARTYCGAHQLRTGFGMAGCATPWPIGVIVTSVQEK